MRCDESLQIDTGHFSLVCFFFRFLFISFFFHFVSQCGFSTLGVPKKIRFSWQGVLVRLERQDEEPELLLHQLKKPVKMIWAYDQDVSMTPPCGDIPGILNRREALGHTRGILYPGLQGLGIPISPRRSWRTFAGEKNTWATLFSLLLPQHVLE